MVGKAVFHRKPKAFTPDDRDPVSSVQVPPWGSGGWARGRGFQDFREDGELPKFYFSFFPFPFSAVPNSSFTILTAHKSPHIEQVSCSPSRSRIRFAWAPYNASRN